MGLEELTNTTKVYRQDSCPGRDAVFTELPCKYFSTAGNIFISLLCSKKQGLATADLVHGNREMSCIRLPTGSYFYLSGEEDQCECSRAGRWWWKQALRRELLEGKRLCSINLVLLVVNEGKTN
jgi:hypothetical protein